MDADSSEISKSLLFLPTFIYLNVLNFNIFYNYCACKY